MIGDDVLAAYLTRVTQLLQNPPASTQLYATSDLTSYINTARGQLAGETECIRYAGTLTLSAGTQSYAFSAVDLGVSSTTGISGMFNTRGLTIGIASGQIWVRPRGYPYFQLYFLNNPVPSQGVPREYSQFGQGTQGSLYLAPVPDQPYVLTLDCVCKPIDLIDDTTVEAIPYPYTDCVPYYAVYLAYLSAQRSSDADEYWKQYQTFVSRARQLANGSVNPQQYPQSGNPTRSNQLGIQPTKGGQ